MVKVPDLAAVCGPGVLSSDFSNCLQSGSLRQITQKTSSHAQFLA
jgi:hypothetical protein